MPTREIRALSLWQPWASLVALGLKSWETRGWATGYRGPLLIHAARCWEPEQARFLDRVIERLSGTELEILGDVLPTGAFLAIADLAECRPTSRLAAYRTAAGRAWVAELSDFEREAGDFSVHRFGWLLRNVVRFPVPIPGPGQQGLWVPPAEILERVEEATRVHATPNP